MTTIHDATDQAPRYGYPNLWGYARDLYQRPAFRDTTDLAVFGSMFAAGPVPSFFNDAPWRIRVDAGACRVGQPAPP